MVFSLYNNLTLFYKSPDNDPPHGGNGDDDGGGDGSEKGTNK